MAKSREINMNLPSADDLFTTQEERDHKNQEYVKNISIYEITDFPNHPFKVKMDERRLKQKVECIIIVNLWRHLVRRNQPAGLRKKWTKRCRKLSIACVIMVY